MQDSLAGVLPPTRLGRYEIIERLGAGGMAEVFLAVRHGAAGFARAVAVKRILPQYGDKPEFIRMLQREAAIAAMMHHPNCVQVNELEEADGQYFVSMELLFGVSVTQLRRLALERERHLPVAVAVRVAADAAHALHHVHTLDDGTGNPLGIVHRDISPQNLFVTERGLTKVLDFGIAKAMEVLDQQTRTGVLMGKAAYMAPEQVRASAVDARCDVWALGVTLWELLTGRDLFRRPALHDTLDAIATAPIPPPSSLRPSLPSEVDRVVLGMLRRDRVERTPSAAAVARALDTVLSSLPGAGYGAVSDLVREVASEEIAQLKAIAASARKQSVAPSMTPPSSPAAAIAAAPGSSPRPPIPASETRPEGKRTPSAFAETLVAPLAARERTPSASLVRSRDTAAAPAPVVAPPARPRSRFWIDAVALAVGGALGAVAYQLLVR